MIICENCGNNHKGDYGSGRFCSTKCARCYSTKSKRLEINKKVSKKLTKNNKINKKCLYCGRLFIVPFKKRNQKYCNKSCAAKHRWENDDYRKIITKKMQDFCKTIERRLFLKEIGRKGGFGKKGYINNVRYDSMIEKKCFEYLFEKNINFIPHKSIPNTSKISDIYLNDLDLWIEIDGINREKRKKWLGKNYNYWLEKLKLYKEQKLKYEVFTDFLSFKKFIDNAPVV